MKKVRKRPVGISILLSFGYIFALVGLMLVFSHQVRSLGDWFPALFGSLIAIKFIALVGLWYMKRWALKLYILVVGFTFCVEFLINNVGPGGILTLIYSSVIISVVTVKWRRLTPGL